MDAFWAPWPKRLTYRNAHAEGEEHDVGSIHRQIGDAQTDCVDPRRSWSSSHFEVSMKSSPQSMASHLRFAQHDQSPRSTDNSSHNQSIPQLPSKHSSPCRATILPFTILELCGSVLRASSREFGSTPARALQAPTYCSYTRTTPWPQINTLNR